MATDMLRVGAGQVPAAEWSLKSARKQVLEYAVDDGMQAHVDMGIGLEFSKEGVTPEQLEAFLRSLMGLDGAEEPIIQSGGIYGVSSDFDDLNAKLLMFQLKHSAYFFALAEKDQQRALDMFGLILNNHELRNRNPIHLSLIDSCLISNLLNFPKHLFGFPYACYGSDGNESLSLVLFSYRQRLAQPINSQKILYVGQDIPQNLKQIAERLVLQTEPVSVEALRNADLSDVAVVLVDVEDPAIQAVAAICDDRGVGCHTHVEPRQWRDMFLDNKHPVHFELPSGVTSMSIDAAPMLQTGYSLYKDFALRDAHMDIPRNWQTVYISPNEGGSNSARGLYLDLCTFSMGWATMRDLAAALPLPNADDRKIYPSEFTPRTIELAQQPMRTTLDWAYEQSLNKEAVSREALELELVRFQLEFLGGMDRNLDAMTTGGGTRSINLAFQSVIGREKARGNEGPYRVVTGNPHLAVERAEERFGMELVRTAVNGSIEMSRFRQAIKDPQVMAVYAQTLSYTDGTTDPLREILDALIEENTKRSEESRIVLINDSCLAFSVLLHNDGKNGTQSLRLLDVSKGSNTPVIVINDPHKHLGTDKGISTLVSTAGMLTHLKGRNRVGRLPDKDDLIRAIANLRVVGRDGYFDLYHALGDRVAGLIERIEAQGVGIMHKQNRVKGSTVIAVEDPSGYTSRQLKKKAHSVMQLFQFQPNSPNKCQTGWQLSLTVHSLRKLENGQTALEKFTSDFEDVQRKLKKQKVLLKVQELFGENSIFAFLIAGNVNPYLFGLLRSPGPRRDFACTMIRRFVTGTLDYGKTKARPDKSLYVTLLRSAGEYMKKLQMSLAALVVIYLIRRMRVLKST